MIEEIKFEEIIRTENGKLYKIVSANEQDFLCIEMKENATSLILLSDLDIKTHSKNIIDLIEAGDFVNGRKVYQVGYNFQDDFVCKMSEDDLGGYRDNIYPKDIKSIVTKEQFESIEYKV